MTPGTGQDMQEIFDKLAVGDTIWLADFTEVQALDVGVWHRVIEGRITL